MRFNHIVAALALVTCLSMASSAVADRLEGTTAERSGNQLRVGEPGGDGGIASGSCEAEYDPPCPFGEFDIATCNDGGPGTMEECFESCFGTGACITNLGCPASTCTWLGEDVPPPSPPPVPAASEWGMASVVLLLLTGLTIKFGVMRFRKAA